MTLATMLLAALASAAFPAAGTYRYAASMNGETIGSWSVSVSRDQNRTQVAERSTASIFGMQLSATASLVLAPDLAPTSYTGDYHTPRQNPHVTVTVTGSTATVVGAFSSQPQQVALAANTRHFVVVEPGLLAGLFALPAQLGAWQERAVTGITPTTAQAEVVTIGTAPTGPLPSGVPPADVALAVEQPVRVTIWYDPATLVPDQISVPSQNAVLTRIR